MAALIIAAIGTSQGKFWTALFAVIERVAVSGAALATMILMVEGVIVGATKIIINTARKQARQEGDRSGYERAAKIAKRSGVDLPPYAPPDDGQSDTSIAKDKK